MVNDTGRTRGGNGRGRAIGRGGPGNRGRMRTGGRGSGRGQAAPADNAAALGNGLPANWPSGVTYLTTPVYAGISPRQRQLLQTQPSERTDAPAYTRQATPLPEMPSILRFGPSPLVEIRSIADAAHPACGQRGLFAARHLPPGSFIVPYLGVYHRGNVAVGGARGTNLHNKRESDYDLWLDRDADVAIDADRQGNEARFINDYRGTGQPRPTAEFREVWDPRRGERGMAVFVLPAGKRVVQGAGSSGGAVRGGIAKGDEILVSYGKGFWEMRQKETAAAREEDGKGGALDDDKPSDETTAEIAEEGQPGRAATVDAEAITDRMGSLTVVAKFPKDLTFEFPS